MKTKEEQKKFFNINKCPNKSHWIYVGNFAIIRWIIAEDYWSILCDIDGKPHAMDMWLHFGRERHKRFKLYNLIIWKLSISIGFIKDYNEEIPNSKD